MRGVNRKYLSSYLDEFTYRHNLSNRVVVVEPILNDIATQYDLEATEFVKLDLSDALDA